MKIHGMVVGFTDGSINSWDNLKKLSLKRTIHLLKSYKTGITFLHFGKVIMNM
jgi:hypothetical protein